ncbi:MAG: transglycosylase family protein [Dehalococcoidia bacterium]|nr:transglycosylase family protein [Dehalococcoidia bacterium]
MIDAEAVHTNEQIRELDSPIGPGFTDPADLNAIDVANAFHEDERRAHEAALAAEVVRQEAEAEAVRQAEAQAALDAAERQRAEAARVAAEQAAGARAAEEARLAAARAAAAPAVVATPAATPARTAAAQNTVASALSNGSWIQEAAAAAGWPADQLAKVERVVMCESGGRTTAVSPAGYVGLMQVAPWLHGAVPADAVGQLAQGYGVYLRQGWGAWPVCGR